MSQENISKTEAVEIITNKRNEMIGFSALTVFIVTMLIAFAIRPTILTILTINSEIKQKKVINEQLDKKIVDIANLGTQYKAIKDDADNLRLTYPNRGDFSLFMANSEKLCDKNAFALQSISFSQSQKDPSVSLQKLKAWEAYVQVKGDQSNLVSLLQDFEKLPMYPKVLAVAFTPDLNKPGENVYSISLQIYYLEDPLFYN